MKCVLCGGGEFKGIFVSLKVYIFKLPITRECNITTGTEQEQEWTTTAIIIIVPESDKGLVPCVGVRRACGLMTEVA